MVKQILWLGFFLRLVLAFVNDFVGPTPGSSDDALGFHLYAIRSVSYTHLTLPTKA